MELIHEIYQAHDGKIFQGSFGQNAKEQCRLYEMQQTMRPLRIVLEKIGYSEADISENYNGVFSRRHEAIVCSASPLCQEHYEAVLKYISAVYRDPVGIAEHMKLHPHFPMEMRVLVYKNYKRYHAIVVTKEIAASFSAANEIGVTETHQQEETTEQSKTKPTRATKVYPHGGKSLTMSEWARELGISLAAMSYRIKHMGPKAFTEPRRKWGPGHYETEVTPS